MCEEDTSAIHNENKNRDRTSTNEPGAAHGAMLREKASHATDARRSQIVKAKRAMTGTRRKAWCPANAPSGHKFHKA